MEGRLVRRIRPVSIALFLSRLLISGNDKNKSMSSVRPEPRNQFQPPSDIRLLSTGACPWSRKAFMGNIFESSTEFALRSIFTFRARSHSIEEKSYSRHDTRILRREQRREKLYLLIHVVCSGFDLYVSAVAYQI